MIKTVVKPFVFESSSPGVRMHTFVFFPAVQTDYVEEVDVWTNSRNAKVYATYIINRDYAEGWTGLEEVSPGGSGGLMQFL